ncbi:hypothetical protein CBM2626_B10161 [Cupriavidus taiwanensis]|uniref:Uncharacterized protein n=1 Tax=Cupriavidus taiwanensis TaxID=164546 RepID=A0A976G4W8_9BURK|nr:hypothetical protein CBM2614_B20017 [Cupriavidus taiwanensis]SOZ68284.1 hypothetical protein CBM2615_B20017 [Cupriavidus taiwanensis]SOZ72276.1 hypothetical protein CBM2613_B20017 [Cupriavidus taiwanensis]SPA00962.1 hypothetical protein CBM2626_B10161 [Cupriavidus taiwanensis]SPA09494.1 hypothetical protein CBM2625_B20017 [Cupriavidus taiwanensis]
MASWLLSSQTISWCGGVVEAVIDCKVRRSPSGWSRVLTHTEKLGKNVLACMMTPPVRQAPGWRRPVCAGAARGKTFRQAFRPPA